MGRMKEAMGDFYPSSPGYKEPTTSRDAASRFGSRAGTLRERILTLLAEAGDHGMTTDEAATRLQATVLAIRPRFSELKADDKIGRHPYDLRRKNESGVNAAVWVTAQVWRRLRAERAAACR